MAAYDSELMEKYHLVLTDLEAIASSHRRANKTHPAPTDYLISFPQGQFMKLAKDALNYLRGDDNTPIRHYHSLTFAQEGFNLIRRVQEGQGEPIMTGQVQLLQKPQALSALLAQPSLS